MRLQESVEEVVLPMKTLLEHCAEGQMDQLVGLRWDCSHCNLNTNPT